MTDKLTPIQRHKNMVAIIGDNAMKRWRNFDINAQMWLEVKLLKGLIHVYTLLLAQVLSNLLQLLRGFALSHLLCPLKEWVCLKVLLEHRVYCLFGISHHTHHLNRIEHKI